MEKVPIGKSDEKHGEVALDPRKKGFKEKNGRRHGTSGAPPCLGSKEGARNVRCELGAVKRGGGSRKHQKWGRTTVA